MGVGYSMADFRIANPWPYRGDGYNWINDRYATAVVHAVQWTQTNSLRVFQLVGKYGEWPTTGRCESYRDLLEGCRELARGNQGLWVELLKEAKLSALTAFTKALDENSPGRSRRSLVIKPITEWLTDAPEGLPSLAVEVVPSELGWTATAEPGSLPLLVQPAAMLIREKPATAAFNHTPLTADWLYAKWAQTGMEVAESPSSSTTVDNSQWTMLDRLSEVKVRRLTGNKANQAMQNGFQLLMKTMVANGNRYWLPIIDQTFSSQALRPWPATDDGDMKAAFLKVLNSDAATQPSQGIARWFSGKSGIKATFCAFESLYQSLISAMGVSMQMLETAPLETFDHCSERAQTPFPGLPATGAMMTDFDAQYAQLKAACDTWFDTRMVARLQEGHDVNTVGYQQGVQVEGVQGHQRWMQTMLHTHDLLLRGLFMAWADQLLAAALLAAVPDDGCNQRLRRHFEQWYVGPTSSAETMPPPGASRFTAPSSRDIVEASQKRLNHFMRPCLNFMRAELDRNDQPLHERAGLLYKMKPLLTLDDLAQALRDQGCTVVGGTLPPACLELTPFPASMKHWLPLLVVSTGQYGGVDTTRSNVHPCMRALHHLRRGGEYGLSPLPRDFVPSPLDPTAHVEGSATTDDSVQPVSGGEHIQPSAMIATSGSRATGVETEGGSEILPEVDGLTPMVETPELGVDQLRADGKVRRMLLNGLQHELEKGGVELDEEIGQLVKAHVRRLDEDATRQMLRRGYLEFKVVIKSRPLWYFVYPLEQAIDSLVAINDEERWQERAQNLARSLCQLKRPMPPLQLVWHQAVTSDTPPRQRHRLLDLLLAAGRMDTPSAEGANDPWRAGIPLTARDFLRHTDLRSLWQHSLLDPGSAFTHSPLASVPMDVLGSQAVLNARPHLATGCSVSKVLTDAYRCLMTIGESGFSIAIPTSDLSQSRDFWRHYFTWSFRPSPLPECQHAVNATLSVHWWKITQVSEACFNNDMSHISSMRE